MLPADHPRRISSRLDDAIAAVEAGRAADAESILIGVIEDEETSLLVVGCLSSRCLVASNFLVDQSSKVERTSFSGLRPRT